MERLTIDDIRAHLSALPTLEGITAHVPAADLLHLMQMGDLMAAALGDVGQWFDTLEAHNINPPGGALLLERVRERLAGWPKQERE